MFRRTRISTRLNLLGGMFAIAVIALVALDLSSIESDSATQRRLIGLAERSQSTLLQELMRFFTVRRTPLGPGDAGRVGTGGNP